MAKITEFLRNHVLAALTSTTILGAIVGVVATDFGNFRATNREIAKRQLEISETADRELGQILQKFADKARGKIVLNDEEVRALKASVSKSYMAAENLSNRFPATKPEFEGYADSLVSLQKSAEKMSGPLDAKSFVEAVSKYYISKKTFDERVNSSQARWPL
jgi:hypothetical protein